MKTLWDYADDFIFQDYLSYPSNPPFGGYGRHGVAFILNTAADSCEQGSANREGPRPSDLIKKEE